MQLADFYDYKNKLMEDLVTNEKIVSLIDEDLPPERGAELIYKQIFPYEYVPDTAQEGKTFICCDVDILGGEYKTFYAPVLYIWLFTHSSKLRLPQGGVRTDKLASEICNAINGSFEYGLGSLDLYSVKRFAPMTDFQGKCLTFHLREFNRQFDPQKYIPTNRKRGDA